MAAAGGDTVVPTNWMGLILTAVAIAVIAAAAYFGLETIVGDAKPETEHSQQETSLQDLYSSNAHRGIEAMETVRALPRSVLAPQESLDAPMPLATEQASETDSDADLLAAQATSEADEEEKQLAEEVQEAAAAAAAEAKRMAAEAAEKAEETARQVAAKAEEAAHMVAAKADEARQAAMAMAEKAEETLDTRYRATTEALRAWWSDVTGSEVGIRFIGPLDSSVAPHGLAILFDQPVKAAEAARFIELKNANGNLVNTSWNNGENPNLIFAPNLHPGRYTLELRAGLTSTSGNSLAETISGAAFVN